MEVSSENCCQRQAKAVCAFCIGLILVPITMGVVFWNENDEVVNYATADLVNKAEPVVGCLPKAGDGGKLVFAACNVKAPNLATQLPSQLRPFLAAYEGSSLEWGTEIYQWTQTSHESCTKDNHGGKHCVTTYSCSQTWSSTAVDSSSFRCPERPSNSGHDLPSGFQARSSIQADPYSVTLQPNSGSTSGATGIALDQNLQLQLPYENLASKLSGGPGGGYYNRGGGPLSANMLSLSGGYLQTARGSPRTGDLRISLSGRSATQATVAAKQDSAGAQTRLGPWPSEKFGWFGKRTKPLEKLEPGILSTTEFIRLWRSEIAAQAWIIRFVTFIVMVIAFEMMMQPLSVAADLVRMLNWCTCCLGTLLDDLAQCVIHTIAFVSAVILWLVTFAVAWIVARPLLGICILALDIALIVAAVTYARKRKGARQVGDGLLHAGVPEGMGGYPTAAAPAQMQFAEPRTVAMPTAQATPGTMMMNVTCPQGVQPGGLVSIMTPSGRQVSVTVPANVYPGQNFTVQVPA